MGDVADPSYIPRNLPRHAASISIINPHGKITKTREYRGSDPRIREQNVCALHAIAAG